MANSVTKVRAIFLDKQKSLTLTEIKQAAPELKASQISMALCYLRKQRYLDRTQVKNEKSVGRRTVWLYTYHETKLPKSIIEHDSVQSL